MRNLKFPSAVTAAAQPQFKRRAVLSAIGAAGALAVVGVHGSIMAAVNGASSAAVDAAALAGFVRLSEFATHRKLDPILAGRYYEALKKRNQQLDAEVAQALDSIAQSNAADIDAFIDVIEPQIKTTVVAIVSAWYLGFVGSGKDVELISYARALMYEPARGILVVPSYGGGPNSWGEKPPV